MAADNGFQELVGDVDAVFVKGHEELFAAAGILHGQNTSAETWRQLKSINQRCVTQGTLEMA